MSRSTGETVKTIRRGNHTFYIRLEQPFNTYAVRIKVKNMEPFYLEGNNDWDTVEDAEKAIKVYIKEQDISIDDNYKKAPGKRGSEADWKKAAEAILALQGGTKNQWLAVLALTSMPTMSELKKAYKAAAVKAHPDLGGSAEAIHKVTEAYKNLKLMV